jgi:7-carboxy-7-deazaguanine synthase
VFVRLTGCPLRCRYCDTEYAFYGGEWWETQAILARVREFGTRFVCVTGGEPLAQKGCLELLTQLCDAGFRVSLETSGAMPLAAVDARVVRVVDVKTPGSGEERRNLYAELAGLRQQDLVKFVICDRADYEWSCARLRELALPAGCTVLFSPSHEQLPARELADWVLEDRLPVRFQVQLHKYLWGNVPGK